MQLADYGVQLGHVTGVAGRDDGGIVGCTQVVAVVEASVVLVACIPVAVGEGGKRSGSGTLDPSTQRIHLVVLWSCLTAML